MEIVRRYVDVYEATMKVPWSIANADNEFIDKLLAAIVGFTIDIERIEGKWKLSQNHDLKRRTAVIQALQEAGGDNCGQISDLMLQTLKDHK